MVFIVLIHVIAVWFLCYFLNKLQNLLSCGVGNGFYNWIVGSFSFTMPETFKCFYMSQHTFSNGKECKMAIITLNFYAHGLHVFPYNRLLRVQGLWIYAILQSMHLLVELANFDGVGKRRSFYFPILILPSLDYVFFPSRLKSARDINNSPFFSFLFT